MNIHSTYSAKIKHYNNIFKSTVEKYRQAVDFFIDVCLNEWDSMSFIEGNKAKQRYIETLSIGTKDNPNPKYDFCSFSYKFPCYYRRAAISDAIGKVSSYKSNLANWEANPLGKHPGIPKAGYIYPVMYKGNTIEQISEYTFMIKVYIRNTWDWLNIDLCKSDIDYINHHCSSRTPESPTLQKRGKEWFLDFKFKEYIKLPDTDIFDKVILAVDLGINSACTCSVMDSSGTILGRKFLKLPSEQDSLIHALNRIKKAQSHGASKMPRLWARVKGINDDIVVKTANFIINTAILYNVNVIVFEHLDLNGKKHGGKKQRLHHWKACAVQRIVTDKAHRNFMRISHVNAWGTSKFAYDGSGTVLRGAKANLPTYSLCRFRNGRIYNCDLSASYNIGARYFIREILKSYTERERLLLEAKVPQVSKRSTCTLSDLVNLCAVTGLNVAV